MLINNSFFLEQFLGGSRQKVRRRNTTHKRVKIIKATYRSMNSISRSPFQPHTEFNESPVGDKITAKMSEILVKILLLSTELLHQSIFAYKISARYTRGAVTGELPLDISQKVFSIQDDHYSFIHSKFSQIRDHT